MPGRDPSERERLLKLIDRTPRPGTVPDVSAATPAPKAAPAAPKENVRGAASKRASAVVAIHPAVVVRRIASAILVAVLLYGAIDVLIGLLGATGLLGQGPAISPSAQVRTAAQRPLDPLGSYLTPVGQKSVFDPARILAVPQQAATDQSAPLGVSGLRLAGVDWGDEPVAFIEDTGTGKTYFVKQGDSIKNIKINEVQRNRVLIDIDGTVSELKA